MSTTIKPVWCTVVPPGGRQVALQPPADFSVASSPTWSCTKSTFELERAEGSEMLQMTSRKVTSRCEFNLE